MFPENITIGGANQSGWGGGECGCSIHPFEAQNGFIGLELCFGTVQNQLII